MGVMLKKVARVFKREGGRAVVRRAWARIGDLRRIRRSLREQPRFDTNDALLDFSLGKPGAFIGPMQIRSELKGLLDYVRPRRPRRVMEIGTANGGTLFLWTRIAADDADILSLDLPGGTFGDGYPAWKNGLYRSFALPGQRITLVRGDSHDPASLEKVRAHFRGEPVDYLFIDGDHSYDGVKRDFEMYKSLVRPGGVIALHDVAKHNDVSCQVDRFWNEVKVQYPSREFIAQPPQGWAGIGAVEVPA